MRKLHTLLVIVLCGCLVSNCGWSRMAKGGTIGAGVGAVVGGLVGHKAGNTAVGAIVGAAVGGAAEQRLAGIWTSRQRRFVKI